LGRTCETVNEARDRAMWGPAGLPADRRERGLSRHRPAPRLASFEEARGGGAHVLGGFGREPGAGGRVGEGVVRARLGPDDSRALDSAGVAPLPHPGVSEAGAGAVGGPSQS